MEGIREHKGYGLRLDSEVHTWSYYWPDLQMGAALVAHIGLGWEELPGSECASNAALMGGVEEIPGTRTLQLHSL